MTGANFGYDPEAVIQDADIEMADHEAAGARAEALRRRGICVHGWIKDNNDIDFATCLDCGKVATWAELEADGSKLM